MLRRYAGAVELPPDAARVFRREPAWATPDSGCDVYIPRDMELFPTLAQGFEERHDLEPPVAWQPQAHRQIRLHGELAGERVAERGEVPDVRVLADESREGRKQEVAAGIGVRHHGAGALEQEPLEGLRADQDFQQILEHRRHPTQQKQASRPKRGP